MSQSTVLRTPQKVTVETEIGGRTMRFETGELAKQAGGAVLVTYGETVVLVTATCNPKPKTGVTFFPLTVDYEEKMYAAGKIPGGWIKREGRPPERTTLTSRLIDRPIRPQFPEGFRCDTHVVGMCFSVDGENDPDVLAVTGAGAALSISDIPFDGPVAAVRVGYVDGEFRINPTQSDLELSSLNLVVAGTRDSICMVEAGAQEVTEDLILEAFEEAHESIRKIIGAIDELVAKAGKPKREYPLFIPDADLDKAFRKHFHGDIVKAMRIVEKQARKEAFSAITREALIEKIKADKKQADKDRLVTLLETQTADDFENIHEKVQGEEMVNMIVDEGLRPDGRKTTEIRPLSARVAVMPRTHGTGLFTRGQTQILTLCTLGTLAEEQSFDNIIGEVSRRYLHHYNFPPFSVGEVRFMRGPGRREIGHGALAERALVPVIPSEDEFPYTMRVVSEALESNGSTSMASVCGSTLALMDAGVPIKAPVGGIAMGLVAKGSKFTVLTDIQGLEDHLGDMDFKVAGTRVGITALQMDIKIKGISNEILRQALAQAKDARMEILDVIEATLPGPRPELSLLAPRITCFNVNPERIKDIIGPGGKTINRLVAETGVKIDIENDGRVFVAAVDRNAVEKAQRMIEELTRDVEAGSVYQGTVMRLMTFGAFVEILPGREGLLHISQLKPFHVAKVEDVCKVGDVITVVVEEIDSMGRVNLTRRGHFTEEELAEAETKGGVRPARGEGERSSAPPREGGRPSGGRSSSNGFGRGGDRGDRGPRRDDRPRRDFDRPERDAAEERPREDRPREDRPREDRPREDRPREERPREDRPREERPRDFIDRGPRRDPVPRSDDERPAPAPRRDFDREERPRAEGRPAPRRDFDREDRPAPRRDFEREDRPAPARRDFDREDRPAPARRDFDREDRPAPARRDFEREDRPAPVRRDFDREERPRDRGESRPAPRRDDDRPAPRRDDDRPAPRRDDRPAPVRRDFDRDEAPPRGNRDFDAPRPLRDKLPRVELPPSLRGISSPPPAPPADSDGGEGRRRPARRRPREDS